MCGVPLNVISVELHNHTNITWYLNNDYWVSCLCSTKWVVPNRRTSRLFTWVIPAHMAACLIMICPHPHLQYSSIHCCIICLYINIYDYNHIDANALKHINIEEFGKRIFQINLRKDWGKILWKISCKGKKYFLQNCLQFICWKNYNLLDCIRSLHTFFPYFFFSCHVITFITFI